MTARGKPMLAVVPDIPGPPATRESPSELGLYGEVRAIANDLDRWRRLHERSNLAPPINLAAKARRLFSMKGGCRHERGGFKFEERA